METVTWLWLYDRRWLFGIKARNLLRIWTFPLILDGAFLGSLLYSSFEHSADPCYPDFKDWIDTRMYILIAILICLSYILIKAFKKLQGEELELSIFNKTNQRVVTKYNFWLRRRLIISVSGIVLLLLGLCNWTWTLYGMDLVYNRSNVATCDGVLQDIIWGNLLLTAVFAFPVFWIMFWMITIKSLSLILSVVWPSSLIWIKKKTA